MATDQISKWITSAIKTAVPLKKATFRKKQPSQPWFSENLRAQKRIGRKLERTWRISYNSDSKTEYNTSLNIYKKLIFTAKSQYFIQKIEEAKNSSQELFSTVKQLSKVKANTNMPVTTEFCNTLGQFFIDKVTRVYESFKSANPQTPTRDKNDQTKDLVPNTASKPEFKFCLPEAEQVHKIVMATKSGAYSDPCPPKILHLFPELYSEQLIGLMEHIMNSGTYPALWKSTSVLPLLKKPNLDPEAIDQELEFLLVPR